MKSGSDIDRRAKIACGWVRDIRRTDRIEGEEYADRHKVEDEIIRRNEASNIEQEEEKIKALISEGEMARDLTPPINLKPFEQKWHSR